MNCPKCHAPLLPNARFCGTCGYSLPHQSQTTQQQTDSTAPFGSQLNNQQQNYANRQSQTGGAFRFDDDGRGQRRGYSWEIRHAGSFAPAVVDLQPEASISAEAGAMVSMSGNIDLQSEMKGGVFGAIKRAVGGESAFVSTFTARGAGKGFNVDFGS